MKLEYITVSVIAVGVAVLASIAYVNRPNRTVVEAKPAPCVAGPNEMCPSADWLKDYDEWKALNDKIEGAMKKDRDLRTGWAKRLNESMPPGYYFDVNTRKFGRQEPPKPIEPPKAK